MLRKIRIGISALFFVLITFFFLDFAEILPNSFHRLAHLQFVPALLSLSVGILLFLIVLTLLFGRIYCSTICPMGILQDIIARLSKSTSKKKKRYSYSPAKNRLRWSVLGGTVISFLCGFTFIVGLLEPYSAYGRIVVHVFKPIYMLGNNLLESAFSKFDNYTFYPVDTSILSISSLFIAVVILTMIFIMAWKHGRTWCNTICPVGTILGLLSRFSLFKVRIDSDKCNSCGLCATKCKAACINSKEHTIDYGRCVDCFDCLGGCKQKALIYQPSLSPTDSSKRRFLVAGLLTAGAVPKLLSQVKESVASLEGKKVYKKENPVTPPGSVSREHFQQQCTSCHLCISKCPSHVLKPAFMEYGLAGVMQPTVSFEKGFCNFDCTVCGDVCPNGAILPISVKQKHLTQMGYVVFIEENCIVYTDGTSCGACSEHCPTQAVAMVPYKDGLTIPHVSGAEMRMSGGESAYRGAGGVPEELVKELEKQFGFDKPVHERLWKMIKDYVRFDFGRSYYQDKSVLELIAERMPVSVSLGLWSTLIIYLIAIPLGIKKAVKDGSEFDTWTSFAVVLGSAVPVFLFAVFLIVFFAGGTYFQWFPLRGLTSDNWNELSAGRKVLDYFHHIALPVTAMVIGGFASLTMLTKNSFLEELNKPYVLTARAKGLSQNRILYGHVFRNAMLPAIAASSDGFT